MEDFEKIKEISLEEAQKILPQNIAYLTMNDGEVIVVNGLDHAKFDKKEKQYDEWVEEQNKVNQGMKNYEAPLNRISEATEENERNSNPVKYPQSKMYQNQNINNNSGFNSKPQYISPFSRSNDNDNNYIYKFYQNYNQNFYYRFNKNDMQLNPNGPIPSGGNNNHMNKFVSYNNHNFVEIKGK